MLIEYKVKIICADFEKLTDALNQDKKLNANYPDDGDNNPD